MSWIDLTPDLVRDLTLGQIVIYAIMAIISIWYYHKHKQGGDNQYGI